jgi:hypothetical protein
MEQEEFQWWKYFSAKVMIPLIAMLSWVALIAYDKLQGNYEIFGVGAGLLMFGGILPAKDVLTEVATAYREKAGKSNE